MEFDNQSQFGDYPEKKSGALKWILGGCGCLTVLLLICGGGGYWGYGKFVKPAMDFFVENVALIEESDVVKEKLGEPLEVTPGGQARSGNQDIEITLNVKGQKGRGMVIVEATINPDYTWVRKNIYLEFKGEKFPLDGELVPDLDIDFGGGAGDPTLEDLTPKD